MPYINKKELDNILEKAEETLKFFSEDHYYRIPHEKVIVQNIEQIIHELSKLKSK